MPRKNASPKAASPALSACSRTNGAGRPGLMKNSPPGRLACVDLPAFPLQLLLKRRPEWAAQPVAVVAEDKPQGLVLWVNEKARQFGVRRAARRGGRAEGDRRSGRHADRATGAFFTRGRAFAS